MRCVFFCFLLFLKWNFLPFSPFNAALSEEFSHFLSSCGIYQSKLTFFSPSAVFSLKNNPHSFLRRELGFWQLALSSSIFSPSSFSRLFTVVFPPLWVHTHTNTETAQLLFRFLNSKSPVKLQLFRTHNIPILASFFLLYFRTISVFFSQFLCNGNGKSTIVGGIFRASFLFPHLAGCWANFFINFLKTTQILSAHFYRCSCLSSKKIEQKVSLTFVLSHHTNIPKKKNPARHQSIQSDSSRP